MTLKVRILTPNFLSLAASRVIHDPDLKLSQVSVTPDDGYHLIQFPTEIFDGDVSLFFVLFCFVFDLVGLDFYLFVCILGVFFFFGGGLLC